ncbi:MAG TPA: acyl-CoA dehydrogenase family protein [Blastocatellia bacterium]|nr:acyl-CoA dehydrogenase family protein [Blastocatellia bacterium]
MEFELNEDQLQIKRTIREFAEGELRPHAIEWDETQHFPVELRPKFAELGIMGVLVPEQYGGAGLGYVEYAIIMEELSRVDPAIALSIAAHNSLGSGHILVAGNEAQKQKYLTPLAKGDQFAAWGLTEPSSGSDASSMRTTASRRDGGWVLNGSKNFITNATVADTTVALAITDRTTASHGISAFIIERGTPGFTVAKKENKTGMRASDTAALVFDSCFVPESNLIGEVGQGFIQAMKVLDGGRISIAALSVGIAQGAYEAALKYAKERTQFGRSIAEFQAIQFKIADMATQIEAARLLTYRAAMLKNHGKVTTKESSMAKLYASEVAVRVAEESVQIHGGYGYIKDYPAEKYWRDSKLCTIGEGTSEIQRTVIARQVLRGPE